MRRSSVPACVRIQFIIIPACFAFGHSKSVCEKFHLLRISIELWSMFDGIGDHSNGQSIIFIRKTWQSDNAIYRSFALIQIAIAILNIFIWNREIIVSIWIWAIYLWFPFLISVNYSIREQWKANENIRLSCSLCAQPFDKPLGTSIVSTNKNGLHSQRFIQIYRSSFIPLLFRFFFLFYFNRNRHTEPPGAGCMQAEPASQ